KRIEQARKLPLIILDGAHNSAAGSAKPGLPSLEPEGPTLVASSARHGTATLPASGQNSAYALALAEAMQMPRTDIRLIFKRVRDAVRSSTGNRQEPYTYGSPGGEMYFFKQ